MTNPPDRKVPRDPLAYWFDRAHMYGDALREIADLRLSNFMGPHDMALRATEIASIALNQEAATSTAPWVPTQPQP